MAVEMSVVSPLTGYEPAVLALADGSLFFGYSVGARGHTVGEVVFNTSMTGYQEILTDPSYAEQIVTLTYPHIGNVGVNPEDNESEKIWAAGLIIREISPLVSNWRATQSLDEYLQSQHIVAIAGIDTRRLTRLIRLTGAQHGCIMTGVVDPETALCKAKAFPGLQGKDLATVVTLSETTHWHQGSMTLAEQKVVPSRTHAHHVVAYDFGVKRQMLRMLIDRGCHVTL